MGGTGKLAANGGGFRTDDDDGRLCLYEKRACTHALLHLSIFKK